MDKAGPRTRPENAESCASQYWASAKERRRRNPWIAFHRLYELTLWNEKKTKKKASKILYSAFQWYWYLINLLRACKFCNSFNEAFPNKGKEKWTYFYALHIIFFFNFLHFLYRMSMFSSVFALFTWVNEVCHVSFASINLSCSELSWNKFLFICDVNWYQPRRWPWTPGDDLFVIYNQCKVTTVVMTTSVYLSIS